MSRIILLNFYLWLNLYILMQKTVVLAIYHFSLIVSIIYKYLLKKRLIFAPKLTLEFSKLIIICQQNFLNKQ